MKKNHNFVEEGTIGGYNTIKGLLGGLSKSIVKVGGGARARVRAARAGALPSTIAMAKNTATSSKQSYKEGHPGQ